MNQESRAHNHGSVEKHPKVDQDDRENYCAKPSELQGIYGYNWSL